MSIAAPQIIATLASSAVFHFMQKPRGTPGDHSFSVVLAGGGISTLVAAFLTSRIRDEVELPAEGVVEEGRGTSREGRVSGESARMLGRRGSMSGLEY
jgi:solute carrier family 45 protein 1/2/4